MANIAPENKINTLTAETHFSGFDIAHDTYCALSAASDGYIYYVLSSNTLESGRVYRYNPQTNVTEFLADLNEVCGEKDLGAIPQGKSHSELYEYDGKLYISTHIGYYELIDGFERLPVNPPEGYKLYPGGHIISYDLKTGVFEDLCVSPDKGGFVTMAMDTDRAQIYALTWPKGRFMHFDVKDRSLTDLGPVLEGGEGGIPGDNYRVICRSIVIDSRDGRAYISDASGAITRYDYKSGALEKMDAHLKRDYFGIYDITRPGSMGYNWRKVFWYEPEGVAYGVHGNSGYLFRFDPLADTLEIVDRITSDPSRRSGMYDQFTYGYLGFEVGPDNETIYYLTGGPVYEDGKIVKGDAAINVGSRGKENLHLITFNIPRREYRDHGPIFYKDGNVPSYVNSIAVSQGRVFTMARFEHNGRVVNDLISIPDPLNS